MTMAHNPRSERDVSAPPIETHILAMVTSRLLAVGVDKGLDAAELLREADLTAEEIADPDREVPISKHVALGTAMASKLGRQNAGLHSGMQIFGDPRGALGFAIRRSGTHLAALESFRAFLAVANQSLVASLRREPDETLRFQLDLVPGLADLGHPAEALLAAWVAISRQVTETRWSPAQVTFSHEPRGAPEEHRAFFGCDVRFGARRTGLVVRAGDLLLQIPRAPHQLEQLLDCAWEPRMPDPGAFADSLRSARAELREHGRVRNANTVEPTALEGLARELSRPPRMLADFEIAFLLGMDSVHELRQRLGGAP